MLVCELWLSASYSLTSAPHSAWTRHMGLIKSFLHFSTMTLTLCCLYFCANIPWNEKWHRSSRLAECRRAFLGSSRYSSSIIWTWQSPTWWKFQHNLSHHESSSLEKHLFLKQNNHLPVTQCSSGFRLTCWQTKIKYTERNLIQISL